MVCEKCNDQVYSKLYTIGNANIGYGDVKIGGCQYHVQLTIDRLDEAKGNTAINQNVGLADASADKERTNTDNTWYS